MIYVKNVQLLFILDIEVDDKMLLKLMKEEGMRILNKLNQKQKFCIILFII